MIKENQTYANKKQFSRELNIIDIIDRKDFVIKSFINNLKDPHDVTFDDINTAIYFSAVTEKEFLKDVKCMKV